ncbi:hypothetical protein HU200_013958 [Digitaria exilis]|uniref:Protein kinase domain-containing protein n=1 Tax=Digitaria exilis TaxID=1010633 RepID=A0A835KKL3_9POAL|nr:hypothetical protein HU200_013958 [Digitaria exilis]
MIGSGGFATIHKGVLQDGLVVAIKKFRNPYVLSEEKINELHFISKFEHKNIVKLIGYDAKFGAQEDKETSVFFVEEYMPNGSLEKTVDGSQLDWSSCFLVIQGVALGLRYLHKRNVVHLDVKPSNILLDADMNAKITDFGMARVLNQSVDISTIAGTLGYMPPEYVTDGILSNKHDVYGFGVTLLDVISGMSRSKGASGQASIAWGWEARQAGRMAELLDLSVLDEQQLKEIERCLQVGLLCIQFDPADRPDMLEVIQMLRGERDLRTLVRPGYTTKEQPNSSWFLPQWGCLRVKL